MLGLMRIQRQTGTHEFQTSGPSKGLEFTKPESKGKWMPEVKVLELEQQLTASYRNSNWTHS